MLLHLLDFGLLHEIIITYKNHPQPIWTFTWIFTWTFKVNAVSLWVRRRGWVWRHHIIIIIKKGRECKAERAIYTLWSSPMTWLFLSPTIPTHRKKQEKEKIVAKTEMERAGPTKISRSFHSNRANKNILTLLINMRQFIKCRVTMIVSQRYWDGNKRVFRYWEVLQRGAHIRHR